MLQMFKNDREDPWLLAYDLFVQVRFLQATFVLFRFPFPVLTRFRAEFCYQCSVPWKHCSCELWRNEEDLLEVVVQRENDPRRRERLREQLRRGECARHNFRRNYYPASHSCERCQVREKEASLSHILLVSNRLVCNGLLRLQDECLSHLCSLQNLSYINHSVQLNKDSTVYSGSLLPLQLEFSTKLAAP